MQKPAQSKGVSPLNATARMLVRAFPSARNIIQVQNKLPELWLCLHLQMNIILSKMHSTKTIAARKGWKPVRKGRDISPNEGWCICTTIPVQG